MYNDEEEEQEEDDDDDDDDFVGNDDDDDDCLMSGCDSEDKSGFTCLDFTANEGCSI
jgi:hypothetical protein